MLCSQLALSMHCSRLVFCPAYSRLVWAHYCGDLVQGVPRALHPQPQSALGRNCFLSIKEILGCSYSFRVSVRRHVFGWFSVAQAAAIGSFLAMLMMIFPGRTFTKNNVLDAIKECTGTFAMTFFIVIGASVFSSFLAITQLP